MISKVARPRKLCLAGAGEILQAEQEFRKLELSCKEKVILLLRSLYILLLF